MCADMRIRKDNVHHLFRKKLGNGIVINISVSIFAVVVMIGTQSERERGCEGVRGD